MHEVVVLAYVVHVLGEQVLQGLSDGVALLDDALTSLVARARRVGHQRRTADDTLHALLQRGPGSNLVVAQRVHYYLLLKTKQIFIKIFFFFFFTNKK